MSKVTPQVGNVRTSTAIQLEGSSPQPLNHNFFGMIQIIIDITISYQIDSPHTQVKIKVDCTRMDEIKSNHLWITWIKSTCQLMTQIKFTCSWVTKIKSNSSSMVKIYIFVFHRKMPKLGNFQYSLFHYINNKSKKSLTNVLQLQS